MNIGGGFKPPMMISGERSQRSVFVGNVSYDVPEDTIRQIFGKVGNVLSLKMVHDRETGKPKGYGFIEYQDIPTAELAIRNLNGYELGGRPLRVDSAAGGMSNMEEFNNSQGAPTVVEESPYGPDCDSGKAPEAISKCVTSLAPEKMFELMKQMKEAVRSNPTEVKSMLTSNPQLAYALLQAQVVMRIVDPQVALAMLHRETPSTMTPFHQIPKITPSSTTGPAPTPSQFLPPSNSSMGAPPLHKPMNPSVPVGYGGYPPNHAPPMVKPVQPQMPQVARQQPDISLEDQQNADLLRQVLQLSEEELQLLPAVDRQKVIELRMQIKRNVK